MTRRPILSFLFAIFTLLLAAVPAGAQAPESSLNVNAYQCPADYDEISDCTKLGGAVVAISQDGQPLDQVTTSVTEGAQLGLMWGALISLEVVGGQPAGTVLADTTLSFDAVEGQNPVTLVFVPSAGQGDVDSDSDGLTDAEEAELGTDPSKSDTDGDRLSDGFEAREFGTDPLRADTDEDGLGDGDELEIHKTDALAADTDGDGFDDGTEVDAGSDPLDPASTPDNMGSASSIIVQAFLCPEDYQDKDLITACDEPLADVGVIVGLDASEFGVEGETDADGMVAFSNLGTGAYTVTLGVPGDFARFNVTCGRHTDFEFSVIEASTTNQISFDLLESDEVLCIFLVIPEGTGAPTATPAPTAVATAAPTKPAGPVASLPDTGTGSDTVPAVSTSLPYLVLVAILALAGVAVWRRPNTR